MLKARVVTALFLVTGFLAVLFLLPGSAAVAIFALIAAIGGWEWGGLMKAGQQARLLFAGLLLLACGALWFNPGSFVVLWALAAMFWLGVMPLWLARKWPLGRMGYVTGLMILLPTWAALVDLHARGPELLLAVMALVWVADIAAYFTGRACGRHKLAPTISPGKTWEGAAGAVVGVLIYGMVIAAMLPAVRAVGRIELAGLLLLLTALSIAGDLFESLIKRQAGLKDSSQLLPGHGGILDRIDSQTSTLPLVALCLYWSTA